VSVAVCYETAAAAAGVSEETLRRWRRKGEAALAVPPGRRSPTERRYAASCGAFDQALAETAVRMQEVVFATATQTKDRVLAFRAATWYLVHRERDDYTTRQVVTTEDDDPLDMSATGAFAALVTIANAHPLDEDEDDDG
jgi:hypothetical protein